ncbi:hypothetical protein ACFWTC_31275, partial [Streptomyces sp. NPDC058619]|uniref:hypothetical protein n=1 Tax=Streptomyces sp. NPDC058619 TaxID=3346559 RepID=UPI003666C403
FGTLLSSQGTDASFVLTLSGFPPGFRSVLAVPAFPTLPDSFASDSRSKRDLLPGIRFRVSLSGDSDSISDSPSL